MLLMLLESLRLPASRGLLLAKSAQHFQEKLSILQRKVLHSHHFQAVTQLAMTFSNFNQSQSHELALFFNSAFTEIYFPTKSSFFHLNLLEQFIVF